MKGEVLQDKNELSVEDIMTSYVAMRLASKGWVAECKEMSEQTRGTTNLAKIGHFTLEKASQLARLEVFYESQLTRLNAFIDESQPLIVSVKDARPADAVVRSHTPFMRHPREDQEISGVTTEVTGEITNFGVYGFTVDTGEDVYTVYPADIPHAKEQVEIELLAASAELLAA